MDIIEVTSETPLLMNTTNTEYDYAKTYRTVNSVIFNRTGIA